MRCRASWRILGLTALLAACTGPEDVKTPVRIRDAGPDTRPADGAPDQSGGLDAAPMDRMSDLPAPPVDLAAEGSPADPASVDGTPDATGDPDGIFDATGDADGDAQGMSDATGDADGAASGDVVVRDSRSDRRDVTLEVDPGEVPPEVPAVPCTVSATCGTGVCTTGLCRPEAKLLLYWTFDDQDGSMTAADSSGNDLIGTYVGTGDVYPTLAAAIPVAIMFPDPGARRFAAALRQAATLAVMPPALKFANDFTIAAWFRVKDGVLGTGNGSEVISAGDLYSLRVTAAELEFSKRTTNPEGVGSYGRVRVEASTHLDGNWHHLAGVATPAGMRLYYDGVLLRHNQVGADPRFGADIRYDRGNELWVARHGAANPGYDFNGDIDDVRIYGRPLADSEVAWLAAGKP